MSSKNAITEAELLEMQRRSRLKHTGTPVEPKTIIVKGKKKIIKCVEMTEEIDLNKLNDLHYIRRMVIRNFKFFQITKKAV